MPRPPGVITERHLERDGERLLLRLAVRDAAVLDILTDAPTLARVRAGLKAAPERGFLEYRLGAFGPFDVTVSTSNADGVAIAIDGPDLGNAFRGNQSVVFYVGLDEMARCPSRRRRRLMARFGGVARKGAAELPVATVRAFCGRPTIS
jgi:hypothetical protein